MAEGVRLYVGTQHGLSVWRSRDGGWEEINRIFPDGVFDSVAGCRQRPERVFTTVGQDGLYRTVDGGLHWSRVLEGEVRAVAVSPHDDDVIYAGTEPVHLYRSEDGGDTWQELTGLLATSATSSSTRTTRRSSTSAWSTAAWSAARTAARPGRT